MSDLPDLPPDLRALFDGERSSYPTDDVARDRVLRRLESSVAFGALGVGAGVALAAKTGLLSTLLVSMAKHAKMWVALTFVTGAAAGVAVGETHARLTAPVIVTPVRAPAPIVAPPVPSAPPAATPEPVAVPIGSLPSVPSAAPPVVAPPASTLAAEQSLIDTARSALARGRSDDALRATADHERQFPRGRLAEEREMLAIQALLQAGRRPEAETRARRFHGSYPTSLYGGSVDALLGPRQDPDR